MITLLCIGIGDKRALNVVTPQRMSTSPERRWLFGCQRLRRTRSRRPVMLHQHSLSRTTNTHDALGGTLEDILNHPSSRHVLARIRILDRDATDR